MLFKRKVSVGIWERLRTFLWPRRSFTRSAKYYSKRILRLNATPHAVGAGVAAGVFASFFPLGFHFIIAGLVAWLIAGNLVAAALGTAFGNPLTFPFLWGASYETGMWTVPSGYGNTGAAGCPSMTDCSRKASGSGWSRLCPVWTDRGRARAGGTGQGQVRHAVVEFRGQRGVRPVAQPGQRYGGIGVRDAVDAQRQARSRRCEGRRRIGRPA